MSDSKEEKVFDYGFFGEVTKSELKVSEVMVFANQAKDNLTKDQR